MTLSRILVTGAGGFAGRYLTTELADHGYEVIGLDRNKRPEHWPSSRVQYHRADLSDTESLEMVLAETQPDAIAHLAGWSHVGKSWNDPFGPFETNVVNSIRLYQAASRLLSGESRFLFISSAEVYGNVAPEDLPVSEESPPRPVSPYGVSKLTAEETLRVLRAEGGLPLLVARPFNHAGPGQSLNFALPSFARRIVEIERGNEETFRHGTISTERDFLDVRDVARAYRLIMEHGHDGDLFVVAGEESHSIGSIIEQLFELAGLRPKMKEDPALVRETDVPVFRGSSALLHRRTGWERQFPFRQTLREILEEARGRPSGERKS